jgi:zinc/manganese transport system substrate-binding protein
MKAMVLAPLVLAAVTAGAQAAPIPVVAAENFYGDIVQQIGGSNVTVTSILANPDDDPHLFEASPSTARALADAKLVVYNGVDYDPWMEKLLAAHKAPEREIIIAAELVHHKSGDNPHLWYDPATMPAVATAIAAELETDDPAHKADYESRLKTFIDSLQPFQDKVKALRRQYVGTTVTATEPVAGYLCDALSFHVRNMDFQLAVMNNTDPTPNQVASFQSDIWHHNVKILFYNSQATDDLAKQMLDAAHQYNVPVVGVSETEPPGKTYQQWMMDTVGAVEKALAVATN